MRIPEGSSQWNSCSHSRISWGGCTDTCAALRKFLTVAQVRQCSLGPVRCWPIHRKVILLQKTVYKWKRAQHILMLKAFDLTSNILHTLELTGTQVCTEVHQFWVTFFRHLYFKEFNLAFSLVPLSNNSISALKQDFLLLNICMSLPQSVLYRVSVNFASMKWVLTVNLDAGTLDAKNFRLPVFLDTDSEKNPTFNLKL